MDASFHEGIERFWTAKELIMFLADSSCWLRVPGDELNTALMPGPSVFMLLEVEKKIKEKTVQMAKLATELQDLQKQHQSLSQTVQGERSTAENKLATLVLDYHNRYERERRELESKLRAGSVDLQTLANRVDKESRERGELQASAGAMEKLLRQTQDKLHHDEHMLSEQKGIQYALEHQRDQSIKQAQRQGAVRAQLEYTVGQLEMDIRIVQSQIDEQRVLAAVKEGDVQALLNADMEESANPPGMLITLVYEGGPAYTTGFQAGDVLVSLANRPVQNWADLRGAFRQCPPGEQSHVVVLRNGQRLHGDVLLEFPPSDTPPAMGAARAAAARHAMVRSPVRGGGVPTSPLPPPLLSRVPSPPPPPPPFGVGQFVPSPIAATSPILPRY